MTRGLLAVLCLVAASFALAGDGDFGVLYDADGAAETYGICTACHSERIVAQQGLTREQWDEMLDWMVEEQGMAELPEPLRTTILDYLATNYGVDRPHFPAR